MVLAPIAIGELNRLQVELACCEIHFTTTASKVFADGRPKETYWILIYLFQRNGGNGVRPILDGHIKYVQELI